MFEITFLWKVVITLMCSVLLLLISHIKKRKSHPPGPLGFPLVGLLPMKIIRIIFSNYFPKVSERDYFKYMKEKYGDYWSTESGGQRVVVLASMELVTEAFINNANTFAGRPITAFFKKLFKGKGVIFSNNEIWKENRRISVRALREFGMGKSEIMNQICDEGNYLIKYLSSISSSPINTSHCFLKAITNVISKLAFNEGNNYDDPEFDVYLKNPDGAFQSPVINEEFTIFPKFAVSKLGRYLFPRVEEYINTWDVFKGFVISKCTKKLESVNNTDTPECVFHYLWKNYHQDLKDDEKFNEISIIINDLYIAASETTNNYIKFSCLMLGSHPDLQNDLRNELKILTDDYCQINLDMKKKCPKWSSFLDEIHRYCNVVLKSFHGVLEPCKFRGYTIYPEDILLRDIGTISRDPTLFPNPDLFLPYRFLDESKTQYTPNKNLIPFGIGKRICIGENMTNMKSFLFLTRIVLCFHISLPKETLNNFDDIIEGYSGIVHGPLDHFLNFHLINPI